MNRLRQIAAGAVCAAAATLPILGAGAAQAATTTALTPLTLVNGWTNYGSGTASAAVTTVSGIVHLKGAITTGGTNPVAFTLPAADRPSTNVFVPVDLCDATNGRLDIAPSGVVTVEAEGGTFSNAACFTSLDGVSYAKSTKSFSPLTLVNGWTNAPFGTSNAEVRNIGGIVHLKGAIATTGTNSAPFVLPSADRPASTVYVKVDMCNAANGRVRISPNGAVDVEPE